MKTTATLLLAAGTCGAGFLAGWLVFHSDGTCKVELPPTQPLQRANAPTLSNRAPDLERPDSRLVIQAAPTAPLEPAPTAKPLEIPKVAAATNPPDPRDLPESTLAEMKAKFAALDLLVTDRIGPILIHRFQDGLFDHVSDDPHWSPDDSDWERTTIIGRRCRQDGTGWDQTIFSRQEYPELYVYKDDAVRLEALISQAERDQARQALGSPR